MKQTLSPIRARIVIPPGDEDRYIDVCPHIVVRRGTNGWSYAIAQYRRRLATSLAVYVSQDAATQAALRGHRCDALPGAPL